jgi:hypothetical protein
MAHLLLPPLNATNLFGNTDASLPYCGESFWTTLFALFLKKWKTEYNEDRPHLALKGMTPAERLRQLNHTSHTAKDVT